jgi:hypothetical protein
MRGLVLVVAAPLLGQEFSKSLYPVLEKAQCRGCHNDNGVASTSRLKFPRESADEEEIERFGMRLRRFVSAGNPGESLLVVKPTGRVVHGGGERIKPGSPEEKALRDWAGELAKLPESVGNVQERITGSSRLAARRLTHSQYNHTVRDLLGDETRPAEQFPKEDYVHGFTNQAEAQSISPLQAEAYGQAAARLARNAFRGGDSAKLIPCRPSPACATEFVTRFGARAFRSPLTAADAQRYSRLMLREKDFYSGAQIVVETMLQSPHFLFHLAEGDYGTASRLSYFLWDTMPDEELFRAAKAGELRGKAGIEKQVRRMLDDPRAQESLDEFLAQWLRFDRLKSAIRDRRLYPEFTAELVSAMAEETRRLFRTTVWEDRNFLEFYTADHTFVTPELAKLYGLEAPKEPWGKVALPPSSGRAGFLGQGTFLALTSKPADTSPTERGIFIREHLLCQSVPPPPPGLNASLPPVTDEKPVGARERLKEHLSNQVCASCHALVDPIGFGFERFDAIGRYREKENIIIYPMADQMVKRTKLKPTEYRLEIQAEGQVRGIANSTFRAPRELAAILAKEEACQKCAVKQLFRYATGRLEEPEDRRVIDGVLERFRASGFKFRELILGLATSEVFTAVKEGRSRGQRAALY